VNILGLLAISLTVIVAATICYAGPSDQALGSEQAVAAARGWLDGLKAKDGAKEIPSRTRLPFTYATTHKKKTCDGTVPDAEKLIALVDCLKMRERSFVGELRHAGNLSLKAIDGEGPRLAIETGWCAVSRRKTRQYLHQRGWCHVRGGVFRSAR
jgi:hypothetical protein